MVASGRARDAIVHDLNRAAALDAGEIRRLSRANAVPLASFASYCNAALIAHAGRAAVPHDALLRLLRRHVARDDGAGATPLQSESLLLRAALHLACAAATGGAMHPPTPHVDDLDPSERRNVESNVAAHMPVAPALPVGVTPHTVAQLLSPSSLSPPHVAPQPFLPLLCLHATVMGVRDETAADDGRATPSQRLQLLLRATVALREGTGLSNAIEYDRRDVLDLLQALDATWQVPARTRPIAVVTYPLPLFAVATPEQQLAAAEAEVKLSEERGKAGVQVDAPLTLDEVKRLFFSQSICAWNECRMGPPPPKPAEEMKPAAAQQAAAAAVGTPGITVQAGPESVATSGAGSAAPVAVR